MLVFSFMVCLLFGPWEPLRTEYYLWVITCSFTENGKSQLISLPKSSVSLAFGQPFLCAESQHLNMKLGFGFQKFNCIIKN